ncbi:hypothetical protein SISNIDRAFT_496689 [Sistotremastrum niveocremeum HHB9708]|uniref:Uncharacterized protein n=1 Tax=Sistotremastrum niveocremeum HHB9708 TaxID=1314777 RepID=A0A164RZU8_9AGAM|nr:hypothetical protein SISNIDRAFT_496689 [Sistotremastrum niveocremeum HHB9708]
MNVASSSRLSDPQPPVVQPQQESLTPATVSTPPTTSYHGLLPPRMRKEWIRRKFLELHPQNRNQDLDGEDGTTDGLSSLPASTVPSSHPSPSPTPETEDTASSSHDHQSSRDNDRMDGDEEMQSSSSSLTDESGSEAPITYSRPSRRDKFGRFARRSTIRTRADSAPIEVAPESVDSPAVISSGISKATGPAEPLNEVDSSPKIGGGSLETVPEVSPISTGSSSSQTGQPPPTTDQGPLETGSTDFSPPTSTSEPSESIQPANSSSIDADADVELSTHVPGWPASPANAGTPSVQEQTDAPQPSAPVDLDTDNSSLEERPLRNASLPPTANPVSLKEIISELPEVSIASVASPQAAETIEEGDTIMDEPVDTVLAPEVHECPPVVSQPLVDDEEEPDRTTIESTTAVEPQSTETKAVERAVLPEAELHAPDAEAPTPVAGLSVEDDKAEEIMSPTDSKPKAFHEMVFKLPVTDDDISSMPPPAPASPTSVESLPRLEAPYAEVRGGQLWYTPNAGHIPPIPRPVLPDYLSPGEVAYSPLWWSSEHPWVPFIPAPVCSVADDNDKTWRHLLLLSSDHFLVEQPDGQQMLSLPVFFQWEKTQRLLELAAETLRAECSKIYSDNTSRLLLQRIRQPATIRSSQLHLSYKTADECNRRVNEAVALSYEWAGYLSFYIALNIYSNQEFSAGRAVSPASDEPEGTIPRWLQLLQSTEGLPEDFVLSISSSAFISSFSHGSRTGAFFSAHSHPLPAFTDLLHEATPHPQPPPILKLSPQSISPSPTSLSSLSLSLDFYRSFNIPMWYCWGREEIQATKRYLYIRRYEPTVGAMAKIPGFGAFIKGPGGAAAFPSSSISFQPPNPPQNTSYPPSQAPSLVGTPMRWLGATSPLPPSTTQGQTQLLSPCSPTIIQHSYPSSVPEQPYTINPPQSQHQYKSTNQAGPYPKGGTVMNIVNASNWKAYVIRPIAPSPSSSSPLSPSSGGISGSTGGSMGTFSSTLTVAPPPPPGAVSSSTSVFATGNGAHVLSAKDERELGMFYHENPENGVPVTRSGRVSKRKRSAVATSASVEEEGLRKSKRRTKAKT